MTFTDLCNKVYFLTSTNSTSFPIIPLTVEINNAYDRIVSLIMQSDSRWQYDDENNTDLPIATTDIVSGQQDYSIAVSQLNITRIECLDQSGTWQLLQPIDQNDLYSQAMTEFLKSGNMPKYYDKLGNSIFLYPTPNYSQSASLKLYFKRGPSYFLTSDTTKTPGFNTLYHDLLAYWTAYNFAIANGKSNAQNLFTTIQMKEQALQDDYSLRGKDEHLTLKARLPTSGWDWFR